LTIVQQKPNKTTAGLDWRRC